MNIKHTQFSLRLLLDQPPHVSLTEPVCLYLWCLWYLHSHRLIT